MDNVEALKSLAREGTEGERMTMLRTMIKTRCIVRDVDLLYLLSQVAGNHKLMRRHTEIMRFLIEARANHVLAELQADVPPAAVAAEEPFSFICDE